MSITSSYLLSMYLWVFFDPCEPLVNFKLSPCLLNTVGNLFVGTLPYRYLNWQDCESSPARFLKKNLDPVPAIIRQIVYGYCSFVKLTLYVNSCSFYEKMLENNLSEVVYIGFRSKSECNFITWSGSVSAFRPWIRNRKANKLKRNPFVPPTSEWAVKRLRKSLVNETNMYIE